MEIQSLAADAGACGRSAAPVRSSPTTPTAAGSGGARGAYIRTSPFPISGMHCWHQRVRVERAHSDDRSGDVVVDTRKSMEVYREWLRRTRWPVGPEPREDGKRLRRPLWLNRPLRPTDEAYWME